MDSLLIKLLELSVSERVQIIESYITSSNKDELKTSSETSICAMIDLLTTGA
jgi:hypothetical protein